MIYGICALIDRFRDKKDYNHKWPRIRKTIRNGELLTISMVRNWPLEKIRVNSCSFAVKNWVYY
jgi:hypothetical protein